jgi:hypothetical protein
MSNFQKLFRQSPFASYQEGQIIKKGSANLPPPERFGIKHPVYSKDDKVNLIKVQQMDDPLLKKPLYTSAWKEVSTLRRFKELFGPGVLSLILTTRQSMLVKPFYFRILHW